MALNVTSLKNKIKSELKNLKDDLNDGKNIDPTEVFAEKLAEAIDTYVKSATVNVTVTTTGSASAQTGTGTGTLS
ncbi:hypothetical protein [Flavobacterium oreochromis]|uniref:Uncharacterized protein n=2 Tax=Flavobacterium TaxID=237 RepID=A0A2D0AHN0_9FLAO|nr:hypothetical protein [Flavobacterium oreochromis]OWP75685.1 hypothetical protein BWK62_11495 [Flavobacterium oreochromis]OWP78324.1 hypothetical protein BWG23_02290 [Flavobacterium oreochromis]POR25283.1 hypothetical protein BWK58_07165 [Flavobacterium columnare]QYS85566.1 hypothetical protein JJC03_10120 [Flavobacterium oreochromis]